MKKTLCFVFLVLLASIVMADEMKFSSITANMGKGAFTSGFDVTLLFDSKGNAIEVTGNHERAYGVFFWRIPSLNIKAGICAGMFKNMIQSGPYVIFSPIKPLSVFYWRGWGAGEPNNPQVEINFFFESAGASLSMGNLVISYVWFDFMGTQATMPGVSYTVSINSKFKFFGGVDYKVEEKLPLFRIGVTYSAN